jgi:uncharacterized RDD family membrane protein YckC
MISRKHKHTLRTPEGIDFAFELAGPVSRSMALAIDFGCISMITWAISLIIRIVGIISSDFNNALMIVAYFIISIGYGILFEWYWNGITIGKRVIGLRVVDVGGLRLSFSQVAVRNLLRFIDNLPILYLVGGIAMYISPRAQRLGDLAAGTIVIRSPEIDEPDLSQVLTGKYNSFDAWPHINARLRQNTTPSEASIALQALLRRDSLDPDSRFEVFARLTDHYRSLVAYPSEATDGLSNEQYVRNIVDILYRQSGVKAGG